MRLLYLETPTAQAKRAQKRAKRVSQKMLAFSMTECSRGRRRRQSETCRPHSSKRQSRLQLFLKLFVREFVQQVELAVFVELADARVAHTVEERGLDHGIVDHVFEDDAVADLERFVEREITELVTCEAGIARELICVSLFARECGVDDAWTVRHFEAVRHVGADGNVENGDVHFVVDDVADASNEFTGLPADGFARFHDDLQVRVTCGEILEDAHEFVAVVVLACDVVATAEVHPLHLR